MKSKFVKMVGAAVVLLASGVAFGASYTLSNPGTTSRTAVVTAPGGSVGYHAVLNGLGHALDVTSVTLANGHSYSDGISLNCQITGAQSTGLRSNLHNVLDGDAALICPLFFLGDAPLSGLGVINVL